MFGFGVTIFVTICVTRTPFPVERVCSVSAGQFAGHVHLSPWNSPTGCLAWRTWEDWHINVEE